jgi:TRAP-type mannitol/chloroaromatic compound transport system permease small subunit
VAGTLSAVGSKYELDLLGVVFGIYFLMIMTYCAYQSFRDQWTSEEGEKKAGKDLPIGSLLLFGGTILWVGFSLVFPDLLFPMVNHASLWMVAIVTLLYLNLIRK